MPVATPCRVRRELFRKGDSDRTLVMGASTESLNSVDKAALNRRRTVDMTPTPPLTRLRSKSSQSLGQPDDTQKEAVKIVNCSPMVDLHAEKE